MQAVTAVSVQLPHRRGQPPVQRPQQDGGLPEDLLGLVQPVREVQTCNQVLGEEEGKMLKGKQLIEH